MKSARLAAGECVYLSGLVMQLVQMIGFSWTCGSGSLQCVAASAGLVAGKGDRMRRET
jgi:hypothetical protein